MSHKKPKKCILKKAAKTKRATFSLTDKCIVQLNELAKATGVNKSKLIRMLVDQTSSKKIKSLDNKD